MTYPFVPSYHDSGPARGPRSAFVLHMAEGGGTVGFLSRPNQHGVSVHFVAEYGGRIVQMLALDHMHTSIRINQRDGTHAIRHTDDANGFYGQTAAVAVMGKWADIHDSLGPNHASIAVEVEGFAADGPNPEQTKALGRLYADMRARYPGIRSLGHRDFADYKPCPGRKFPWPFVGGHGPEEAVQSFTLLDGPTGTVTVAGEGHAYMRLSDGVLAPIADGTVKHPAYPVKLTVPIPGPGDRSTGWLVGAEAAFLLASDVTFTADPSCDECEAELAEAEAKVADYADRLGKINGLSAI